MKKIKRYGLGGCAGGLALLLLAILACPNFGSANALPANEGFINEQDAVVGSETGQVAQVYVKPSVSIALNDSVTIETGDEFASGVTDLTVKTNSERGLQLLVNSVNTTDLVETADSTKRISPIGAILTPANFPKSGWGYYVDSTAPTESSEYRPTSTSPIVAKTTTTSGAVNNFKLSIGVKAGPEVGVGIYTNKLLVSVLANPIALTALGNLTYMQDMTPEICKNTPDYVSVDNYAWKYLIDNRADKKVYRVAKLKDGNCWMQENLRLSFDGVTPLTSADSDVSDSRPVADRTMPKTLITEGGEAEASNAKGKLSWNINGNWYYQWNTATVGSGILTTANGQASDSACPKGWKLPLAGINNNNDNLTGTYDNTTGSFKYLLKAYGATNRTSAASPPLLFTIIGAVNNGKLAFVNEESMYWSRMLSTNSSYPYFFDSAPSNVYTSDHYYPGYYGFFVRCVTISN